jgi:predicted molibdopterin-dependent oxidoreductase YjgC
MFKAIDTGINRQAITLRVEGHDVVAHEGETLAIALLNADVVPFRHTPVSGQSRAPLCLMGSCFDCLVEVDGRQNVQACMLEVRSGMQVRLQQGARHAEDAA